MPHSLSSFLDPASIAVVGASADPGRVGGRVVAYLKRNFKGPIIPVNQGRDEVQGLPAVARLADAAAPPELVVVAIPADAVVEQARECAALGVPAMLVFSAGFAETDAAGIARQGELARIARESGMRICGPNCLGLINVASGVMATFSASGEMELQTGPLALVSQSGAFGAQIFRRAQRSGLGVSYFCSTGNEVDVTASEFIAHLVEQDDVAVVMAVIETIRDPDRLLDAAYRAHELGKPLICMKLGTSEEGARAAMSHTGALAGSDRAVSAAFHAAAILRPYRMDQLLGWGRALQRGRRANGNRMGIVTTSGGIGILLTDAAKESALQVPELPVDEQRAIAALVPAFASTTNPVDCTGQIVNEPAMLGAVLDAVARSESVDVVCLAGLPDAVDDEWLGAVANVAETTAKPIVAWCGTDAWVRALEDFGIAGYLDPTETVQAAAAIVRYSMHTGDSVARRARSPRRATGVRSDGPRQFLVEPDAAHLLDEYGIRMPAMVAVEGVDEAARAAASLGYPVVLKVLSYDLPHRSDVGGVVIGIRDEIELRAAYRAIEDAVRQAAPVARWHGVLVARTAAPGLELVCGMQRDPSFGPVLTVGLGGRLVEIYDDVVCRLAPLDLPDAMAAVAEISRGRLVDSTRGLDARQHAAVAEIMVAVGNLAYERPDIAEIDLNPVIVSSSGALAVDALIVMEVTC